MRSGSCPGQQMPTPQPSHIVWGAISTSLPIVLVLILLPALAFATPPDPSWIAGIYDGADGDDIVILVYQTSAASAPAPSPVGPLPCLPGTFLEDIARIVFGSRFTPGPRSPPILFSAEFAYVFSSLPPPGTRRGSSRRPAFYQYDPPVPLGRPSSAPLFQRAPRDIQQLRVRLGLQISRLRPSDDQDRERSSYCPRGSLNNHPTTEETS